MLVEVHIGVCRSGRGRSVLGPTEDQIGISRGGRNLGARLATLLPDPAVDTTVDDLEMSGVDLLVQDAIRSIAGVDVRRDIGTKRQALVGDRTLEYKITYVAYLNDPCTLPALGQKVSNKL